MLTPNPIQAEILATDPKRYLISAGVGVGKTVLSLMLAEGRILVISPKTNRIDENFKRDAELLEMGAPPHISKEDFVKNEPGPCDTLILDECFVSGTKIQTPNGEKNIEDISIGDEVYNAVGVGRVTKLFNHKTKELIRISFSNGQKITVTPNHPFFTTNRGWVNAFELHDSDRLLTSSSVVFNYGNKTFLRKLRKADRAWMASRGSVGAVQKELLSRVSYRFTGEEAKGFFSNNERQSSLREIADWAFKETERKPQYEQSRNQEEGFKNIKENRTQASDSGRKWQTNVSATKEITKRIRSWLGWGICGNNWKRFFTKSLQNRYRSPRKENSDRSGWSVSQCSQDQNSGQKENRANGIVRVESIEVQESTNTRVFNISVSGHPSYIAGGILVHNCEWAFGVEANTYRRGGFEHIKTSKIHEAVFNYIQKYQPKRIYLLSATPCEKRMQAWAAARLLGVLERPDFESFLAFRAATHNARPRGYSTLWTEKKTEKSKKIVRNFLQSFGYFGDMERAKPNIINIAFELTDEQKFKIMKTGEKYPEKKTEVNGSVPKDAIDENMAVRDNIKYGIECGVFTEYIFDDDAHTQKKITTVVPTSYLPQLLEIVNKEQNPIIFVHYTKQIEVIKSYLTMYTNANVVVIKGSTKESDKKAALEAIRNTPNTILIAQAAMSAGWQTLISSATIFASVTRWRHYQQGIGRNSRMQNKDEVKNVYRFYLGPVSHHIWNDIIDQRKDFNSSLQK